MGPARPFLLEAGKFRAQCLSSALYKLTCSCPPPGLVILSSADILGRLSPGMSV